MFKPIHAVAAMLAIMVCSSVVMADDASGPSLPSCAAGELRNEAGLSAEKLAISGALFTALCAKSGGTLINGEAVRLEGQFIRAAPPSSVTITTLHPLKAIPKGKVILAFIVETDGLVSWVSVLESSGNKDLDSVAFWFVKNLKYKTPAKLNGNAVRVYLTTAYGDSSAP